MSRRYKSRRSQFANYDSSDVILSKFTNCIMMDGKKHIASKILCKALSFIEEELAVNAVKVLYEALDNIAPYSEVRSKKVGGVSYQVPVDVPSERRLSLAIKWLVTAARLRKEANMWARLAYEIIDCISMRGLAFKKSQNVRDLVSANQAFSHLGW